jgi:hypothetical protein
VNGLTLPTSCFFFFFALRFSLERQPPNVGGWKKNMEVTIKKAVKEVPNKDNPQKPWNFHVLVITIAGREIEIKASNEKDVNLLDYLVK